MGIDSSLHHSILVDLVPVNLESDHETDFPKLSDLPYKPDESSKFLIKILNAPGGNSFIEVSASETVTEVKERLVRSAEIRECTSVEFAGKILNNKWELSECGVYSGAELSLVWPKDAYEVEMGTLAQLEREQGQTGEASDGDVARGADITFEAQKRDLTNKARARVLYGWNGVLDRQIFGLPLRPNDYVMVGRVVNQDWFEGYLPDDWNRYGLIPRNYVELDCLYDESFRQNLGPLAQRLSLITPSTELPRRRRRDSLVRLLDHLFEILTSNLAHKRKGNKGIPRSMREKGGLVPPLPPSPFPSKPPVPTMDIMEKGNRVRLNFQVGKSEAEEYPTITAILSLIPAPETRISYATVELQFEHDVIVELHPKRKEGEATEVHHNDSVTNEFSGKGGTNQALVDLNVKASHTVATGTEFSRRTRGTILGDGEGSSVAYWVFKEDAGEAGRFGLESEQIVMVKLHARPVRVDYQVNTVAVADNGGAGSWFNKMRFSSGRQTFYFRS
ncbi:hypothetical protein K439DRAFT_1102026 [Ramaria rubella]|nr:hypothetical protein K439DRAFT_1102026 [Ramaria rubella]